MKDKFYKAGSYCMIALGILHTVYFAFSVVNEEAVIYETLSSTLKKGAIWILGERSLLSYYNGYSLSMGLLLISFGLLVLSTNRNRKTTLLCTAISLAAFTISLTYFHLLAYSMLALSTLFFLFSLVVKERNSEAVQAS